MTGQESTEAMTADELSTDEIDGTFVPVPRDEITAVVLDDEAVLLAEGAASAYHLDQLGTLVWGTFDGWATLDELAEDFADAFAADRETVRADILSLARAVGRAGLLVGVREEQPVPHSHALPQGVAVGEPVPPFVLPDELGNETAFSDLLGRSLLLVNWSPRCGFCVRIAPELAELQPDLEDRGVPMVFITLGELEENRTLLEEHGLRPSVVLFGDGAPDAFVGVGTPAAYLIDEQGLAAAELAIGALAVPELVRAVAGRDAPDV